MNWSQGNGRRYVVSGELIGTHRVVHRLFVAPDQRVAFKLGRDSGIRVYAVNRAELRQWWKHPLAALAAWIRG